MKHSQFLAITMAEAKIRSSWWSVDAGALVVQDTSQIHEYKDLKSCIVAIDKSLQELGKATEHISQVLFGFEPSWADAKGIQDDKKHILKSITKELALEPVGFVVVPEALAQHIKTQEPLTSFLLLYVTASQLHLSWVVAGREPVVTSVGKSKETVADVTEALARIKAALPADHAKHWPTKMWVASQELTAHELESIQQELVAAKWQEAAGFIQPPSVQVVTETAVSEAVVHQGGRAVAASLGLELLPLTAPPMPVSPPEVMATTDVAPQTFGFSPVADTDAEEAKYPKTFGIPIKPVSKQSSSDWADGETAVDPSLQFGAKPAMQTWPSNNEELAIEIKPTKQKKNTAFTRWWRRHWRFALVGFVAGLLTLAIVAWGFVVTQTKAVVKITLKTQPIASSAVIKVDPKLAQSQLEQAVLAGQVITVPVQGSASVRTTGVKLVGEKAKGKVTLMNKTDSTKVFAAGTALSNGTVTFTLDKEVTVASASVTSTGGGETRTYGKAEVDVTASKIGEDSNVAKDTELKVADFSSNTYVANASTPMTGGTSREVKVIAEKDRQTVLAQLKTELLKQAEAKFKSETPAGKYSLPTGKLSISKAVYSDEIGAESEEIGLELNADAEAVTYLIADIEPLAKTVLSQKLPSNYVLVDQAPEILTTQQPAASGAATLSLEANFSSKAVPQVNTDQLRQEIGGLPMVKAQQFLQSKPEISQVEFVFFPGVVKYIRSVLPKEAARLHIEVLVP